MAKTLTLAEMEELRTSNNSQLSAIRKRIKELEKETASIETYFNRCKVSGCESYLSYAQSPSTEYGEIGWTEVTHHDRDDCGYINTYYHYCPAHRKEAEEHSNREPQYGSMTIYPGVF